MAKKRRSKVRITTSIDRDVLMWLKVKALEMRMGYQTVLNRVLQEAIAREAQASKGAQAGAPVTRAEYDRLVGQLKGLEEGIERLQRMAKAKRRVRAGSAPEGETGESSGGGRAGHKVSQRRPIRARPRGRGRNRS